MSAQARRKAFDESTLYDDESKLLEQLGLNPPLATKFQHAKEYYLGTIKGRDAAIGIYISTLPAHFFRFVITDNFTGSIAEIHTGSGSLNQYWPSMNQFLEGVLVVRNFTKGKSA